ncbi:hypothetical protein SGPA1_20121 [Streptomyces misionensis JCM 4497]
MVGGVRGALRAAGRPAEGGGAVVRLPHRRGGRTAARRVGVGAGRAGGVPAAGGVPGRRPLIPRGPAGRRAHRGPGHVSRHVRRTHWTTYRPVGIMSRVLSDRSLE